jgi:hypothetical protein
MTFKSDQLFDIVLYIVDANDLRGRHKPRNVLYKISEGLKNDAIKSVTRKIYEIVSTMTRMEPPSHPTNEADIWSVKVQSRNVQHIQNSLTLGLFFLQRM